MDKISINRNGKIDTQKIELDSWYDKAVGGADIGTDRQTFSRVTL